MDFSCILLPYRHNFVIKIYCFKSDKEHTFIKDKSSQALDLAKNAGKEFSIFLIKWLISFFSQKGLRNACLYHNHLIFPLGVLENTINPTLVLIKAKILTILLSDENRAFLYKYK